MMESLRITILVDDSDSWIVPYARELCEELSEQYQARLVFNPEAVPEGDMLFLLGCTRMVPGEILARNRHNLVVHESNLPEGRGWSPVSWQILEGKNRIPVTLVEAVSEMDAGRIYLQDYMELDGTELFDEIKRIQAEKTAEVVKAFLLKWPGISSRPQMGEPTFYPKRTRRDDELDVNKTLADNFDHLRIVNNEKYPAWFKYRGRRYILKIYPTDEALRE